MSMDTADGPRVAIIGAGSFFFGRPFIWNMTHSPVLRGGTMVLVDSDPQALAVMEAIARRVVEHLGVPTRIEASTERRRVLPGCDFVIPSFSYRNAHFRGIDCRIAAKYGVRMCSGDTIGPGGIFRALREVPHLLAVARDVEELCPQAWVINFVNPSTVLGIALAKHAPRVRSMALCDGPHEPHCSLRLLKHVGLLPEDARTIPPRMRARLDLALTGVNHFSWVVRFSHDGRDLLPELRARLAERAARERRETAVQKDAIDVHQNAHAKARFNAEYGLQLMDLFGAYPDCMAHTKEYVPFWQGHGVTPMDPEPLAVFDAEDRQRMMDAHWEANRAYADGRRPIAELLTKGCGDHATDIVESMWGGLGRVFRVNTRNRGAVPNMPDDAFLELACHLDMATLQPLHVGPVPSGVRGLCQRILDCHEATADAATHCDRGLLLRACALDPIMTNLGDNRAMVEELLAAEREALPAAWHEGSRS
jgi:alpha-galactosidase/6-phospho-beta-glucosidase family protein